MLSYSRYIIIKNNLPSSDHRNYQE